MTWAFVHDLEITWPDYQRVQHELGDQRPNGLILHLAGQHNGEVRVIGVWESEAAYRTFREQQLLPAISRARVTKPRPQEPCRLQPLAIQHTIQP
jgi:hypothetical protein